ncbi:hypothetical protein GH714_006448 [Hevea brasiliensis]|uniref:Cytochrome P450 n=1 Tax=Hevea brasiliensis TaxID=3981 RepID=A0A6A6MC54_HEVBR|nr:hypothetical protein GH714_006448 [Hevea brasiliensis]
MLEKISKSSVASKPVNLSEAMMSLTSSIIYYYPFLGFIDKFTGLFHRLEKNFKEFDIFYDQVIQEHLDPSRSKPEKEDILDVLLQLWKNRSFKVDLTFDHIKAVLMISLRDLVFRGGVSSDELYGEEELLPGIVKADMLGEAEVKGDFGDTSAATVVWAMTFLMKNSIAIKKAQEEVRHLVGKKGFVDKDDT